VNRPNPAIVAQSAVRRLPRIALWLLCLAYVLPGYFGRGPWRNADLTSFGYMAELAGSARGGMARWLNPTLMGQPPEVDALLPYWLGAWAMQWAPAWLAPDFAARLPFGLMLTLTLVATWYGVYYLARSPGAQPVAFAFGGEAQPADYARAMADGGLLALIACLGLAQLSHETTPALAQLCFAALGFFALAALPYHTLLPALCGLAGLIGLTLSGAPAVAVALGLGGSLICTLDRGTSEHATGQVNAIPDRRRYAIAVGALGATLLAAGLASALNLWHWRIELPHANAAEWRSLGRLFLWFTWPAWPLALWTLWRWRRQLAGRQPHRHLALPLWFVLVAAGTTLVTTATDRSLLLALPALATLAAFALPTLERSVAALIDWFTLLFFTGCALVIWVIWVAMQTGFPRQPAANVAKLVPGFVPSFSLFAFLVALAATAAWFMLVKWRAGRHRAAIWKSLVLPASGATLCWLLLMTLWLPLLDFARSSAPLVQAVTSMIQQPTCVQTFGLSRVQIAAFQFHGNLELRPVTRDAQCPWLLVNVDSESTLPSAVNIGQWNLQATIRRPSGNESVQLHRRVSTTGN
jgi:hypothetical protein